MKPEDEVSIWPVVSGTSERGTIGREGTIDRVEIRLRESGRSGAEEVEALRIVL